MLELCLTCRHYRRDSADFGTCRVYPPCAVEQEADDDADATNLRGVWPIVEPTDTCGYHTSPHETFGQRLRTAAAARAVELGYRISAKAQR